MNATIDIKTPAGQSLEGFPQICSEQSYIYSEVWPDRDGAEARIQLRYAYMPTIIQLHKGDKITIEIL